MTIVVYTYIYTCTPASMIFPLLSTIFSPPTNMCTGTTTTGYTHTCTCMSCTYVRVHVHTCMCVDVHPVYVVCVHVCMTHDQVMDVDVVCIMCVYITSMHHPITAAPIPLNSCTHHTCTHTVHVCIHMCKFWEPAYKWQVQSVGMEWRPRYGLSWNTSSDYKCPINMVLLVWGFQTAHRL